MSEETVVRTEYLTRAYGDKVAVDGLNLRLARGEIYGFLGPNGAGKTTTILMLLGLTEPTAGRAEVLGLDPFRQPLEVKRRVSYLPENLGFYRDLTGRENLRYLARLNGLDGPAAERGIQEALERVELAEAADRTVATYSRGMRQRLGLAGVLVKKPEVMILDEPTLGLDPQGTKAILDLIRSLRVEQKITVLLCSHQLHQVQEICDRVGIMNQGKLVAEGTLQELSSQGLAAEGGRRMTLEEIYMRYFREA
ncbi:MAG TPA: ABC transporter ATP-binding protein [Planctomycetota bacterium]|jgi:ABC-2 type transport system ATP-binding protein|nr:ABC transporter ATP-binding protein [Planctomycetota bacterium]